VFTLHDFTKEIIGYNSCLVRKQHFTTKHTRSEKKIAQDQIVMKNDSLQKHCDPNSLCADLQLKGGKEKQIMQEEMVGETRTARVVCSARYCSWG